MKKELQWGETPFHRMTPDDLLKAAIRMYDACVSAKSALSLLAINEPYSPFWIKGTGGCALEKCKQVVNPMEKKHSSENIYRAFYRPAFDLLWKDNPPLYLTTGWACCPVCGHWTAGLRGEQEPEWGKRCGEVQPFDKNCQGILRPVTWEDMKIQELYDK